MIWVALAMAAPVRTERIDLFSEEAGAFLFEDLPRATVSPRTTTLRWIQQIRFVATIPRYDIVLGASIASQSVSVRFPLGSTPLRGSTGLTTRLGLPRGVLGGVETWAGPVRIGLGVHLMSDASWSNLRWTRWRVVPGLGIGLGRRPTVF